MKKFYKKIYFFLALNAVLSFAAVDQCKPIGWATRSGRTSTPFEVTGGGNLKADTVRTLDALKNLAKDASPRVIYIDGNLGSGWNGKTGDRVDVTGSNKTIIGLKPGTKLNAVLYVKGASNIIIRNIVIQGPGSNADQAWDNFNIENAKNIWVDHCEFWNGQDGNADVVKGADNVTFTWCKFGYTIKSTHNLSNLIASSDNEPVSEGKLNITFMFNWWVSASQRMPRCRYGNVHVVNNLYTSDASVTQGTDQIGVSAGVQCHVRTEKNVFIGINNPIYNGNNSDGSGGNEVIDNIFTNCTGNTKGQGSGFTPPYDYTDFMLAANQVEATVRAGAGATLSSPTACDANYQDPVEPPPPAPDKEYQAESGAVDGGVLESTNSGYHGEGYVNFDKGGKLTVPVTVEKAGEYKMELDFTNGSGSTRSLSIGVGENSQEVSFAATNAWTTWETAEINLELAAGKNDILFATVGGNDGPNLDQFDLTLVKEIAPLYVSNNFVQKSVKIFVHSGKLILEGVNGQNANDEVLIYDMDGKMVLKSEKTPVVNLKMLPKGVYFAKISGQNKSFIMKIPVF